MFLFKKLSRSFFIDVSVEKYFLKKNQYCLPGLSSLIFELSYDHTLREYINEKTDAGVRGWNKKKSVSNSVKLVLSLHKENRNAFFEYIFENLLWGYICILRKVYEPCKWTERDFKNNIERNFLVGFRFKLRKHLVDFFFFLGKLNCNYFVNYDYYFFKVRRVMKQSLKWHNKNFFSGHVGLKLPFYVSDVLYFNNWFFRKYFFNGMSLIFYNLNVNLQHNIRKKNILFLSIFKF